MRSEPFVKPVAIDKDLSGNPNCGKRIVVSMNPEPKSSFRHGSVPNQGSEVEPFGEPLFHSLEAVSRCKIALMRWGFAHGPPGVKALVGRRQHDLERAPVCWANVFDAVFITCGHVFSASRKQSKEEILLSFDSGLDAQFNGDPETITINPRQVTL